MSVGFPSGGFTVRTKILAAAIATAAVATTVAGCGGSSGSSSKTIKVVYQQQLNNSNKVQANFLAPMVKAFEKANPGTRSSSIPVTASENDYYTKIQLMMRSPVTAPDLVYEDTATINSDIASGYLQPLDSYLKTWSDWSQFAAAVAEGRDVHQGRQDLRHPGQHRHPRPLVQQEALHAGRHRRCRGSPRPGPTCSARPAPSRPRCPASPR